MMTLRDLTKIVLEMRDNHLAHLKEDLDKLDAKVDRMDQRLWWILGILVAATVIPAIAKLFD